MKEALSTNGTARQNARQQEGKRNFKKNKSNDDYYFDVVSQV
jgi:hypothetical protein